MKEQQRSKYADHIDGFIFGILMFVGAYIGFFLIPNAY